MMFDCQSKKAKRKTVFAENRLEKQKNIYHKKKKNNSFIAEIL